MFIVLSFLLFISVALGQVPLGLTYLDKTCYKVNSDMVWFEVDISPKYQRNCQQLHHWLPLAGKDSYEASRKWYEGKSCLRDTKSCCLTCRQYCTNDFRVKTTNLISEMKNLNIMELTSSSSNKEYLFISPIIGSSNYISVDLRQGLRSIIIPMNNLHPDDENYRQVFQIKMTEKIVSKILNNTELYNKEAQTIQSNEYVLGIDKICLLANNVLQTAAMEYNYSNCFKLIPNSEIQSGCGYWGTSYDRDRGYFCASNKDFNQAGTLASCLTNLPLANPLKMDTDSKVLTYMRTAITTGISALPYEDLILVATTNTILGPVADQIILSEYQSAEFNEKIIILRNVRKEILKESSKIAKGYFNDDFSQLLV
ncbi:hypothetical protein K502DRAFT_331205 [Neoconidiobolus thromboides FSU 785]|nr:hypothetical protein K502DRAFT_331205 [Neoconidiobolus thromboides FSU 785]